MTIYNYVVGSAALPPALLLITHIFELSLLSLHVNRTGSALNIIILFIISIILCTSLCKFCLLWIALCNIGTFGYDSSFTL